MSKDKKKDLEQDINIEPSDFDEISDENENFQEKLRKLKEKLKECSKEKQEYLNGWQKERADFANFKTEEGKKKSIFIKLANEGLIIQLLSVLDSFDMAFSNKEAWEKIDKNWRIGVESIYNQFLSVLEQNNVKQIDNNGIFNPEFHQSIDVILTQDKKDDGRIAKIIKKGYKIENKIIRPTQVKVYKYKK